MKLLADAKLPSRMEAFEKQQKAKEEMEVRRQGVRTHEEA